jgi:hypothetical protein
MNFRIWHLSDLRVGAGHDCQQGDFVEEVGGLLQLIDTLRSNPEDHHRARNTLAMVRNAPPVRMPLFFSLPHDPAEIDLAREHDTGCRFRFDEQLIAVEPEVASLLGAVPVLIP